MGLPYLPGLRPWSSEVHKTASYTVLQSDSGTLFVVDSGTVTMTLPTLALGGGFVGFFYNVSANALTITAPANKLIADGNATGTSAAFTTASHIIGSFACVWMNDAGTFYHIANMGGTTVTIT